MHRWCVCLLWRDLLDNDREILLKAKYQQYKCLGATASPGRVP